MADQEQCETSLSKSSCVEEVVYTGAATFPRKGRNCKINLSINSANMMMKELVISRLNRSSELILARSEIVL